MIKIQDELVALQKDILKLTNIKFDAGKASIDEVIEQDKLLKTLQEELNTLKKERTLIEEEIKLVLADSEISSIYDISFVNIPELSYPDSISSDVIESRPDYIAA